MELLIQEFNALCALRLALSEAERSDAEMFSICKHVQKDLLSFIELTLKANGWEGE